MKIQKLVPLEFQVNEMESNSLINRIRPMGGRQEAKRNGLPHSLHEITFQGSGWKSKIK